MQDLLQPLYEDAESLRRFLLDLSEASFASLVDGNFRKILLLAAASAFEAHLTNAVIAYARECLDEAHPMCELIRTQAVERQYHRWFNWEAANVNQFLGMFGTGFKAFADNRIKGDESLQRASRDFLELGNLRNQLVHQNFMAFNMEKTTTEIFALFLSALAFVNVIPALLRDYRDTSDT